MPELRTGLGDLNTLELLVTGDTGQLAINGTVVAVLDLAALNASGRLLLVVWPSRGPRRTGSSITRFQNFNVWSLDETADLAASPVASTPTTAATEPLLPTATPVANAKPAPGRTKRDGDRAPADSP